MNNSLILLLVVSILIFGSTNAQQYSENNSQNSEKSSVTIEEYLTSAKKITQEFKGSPFINETFVAGALLNNNEVLISNIFLRYNAFQDEFQVKKSMNAAETNLEAIRKTQDVYIKIANDIYTYKIPDATQGIGGYYQNLLEGNTFDLFKKNSKKFIEGADSVNKMTGNHAARIVDESFYYLVNSDGKFMEIPSSKRKRIDAIGGSKTNELKKFIKNNKLNINKEEDLIKIISHIND